MPGGGGLNRSRPKLGCRATEEEKTMPNEQIPRGISRKEQTMGSSPFGPTACTPSLQESLSVVNLDQSSS